MSDDTPRDWVRIASFTTPNEADVFCCILMSNEIPTFTESDNLASFGTFLTNAAGGIGVSIPRENVEQALEIFPKLGQSDFSLSEHTESTEGSDEQEPQTLPDDFESDKQSLQVGEVIDEPTVDEKPTHKILAYMLPVVIALCGGFLVYTKEQYTGTSGIIVLVLAVALAAWGYVIYDLIYAYANKHQYTVDPPEEDEGEDE